MTGPRQDRGDSAAIPPREPRLAVAILAGLLFASGFGEAPFARADERPETGADAPSSPALTERERMFLKEHPEVRVGMDPEWPPFSFRGADGRMTGIDADMAALLGEMAGFQPVILKGVSWSELLAMAQRREVDILMGTADTRMRREFLLFTDPYFSSPPAIVTRKDESFLVSLESFRRHNRSLALPQDYAATEMVRRLYPSVRVIPAESIAHALVMVSRGEADGAVDMLPTTAHIIEARLLANLKISGLLSQEFPLRIAVRADWPEMVGILDKSLAAIPESARVRIHDRWVGLNVDAKAGWRRYERLFQTAALVAALAAALGAGWVFTLTQEIRRRRLAEAELITARDRAEAANEAKSAFLANISHEIRNPLNAILGYAEFLKSEIHGPDAARHIGALESGGRALMAVINDVLDLSRIEAGHLELRPAPVNLASLLRDLCDLLSARARQKGIALRLDCEGTLPGLLMLDDQRLRQILFNVIGNAVKFTDAGSVHVRARAAPSARPRAWNIEIEVEDTGPGIPPEALEAVFEPFVQHAPAAAAAGGTGLGLPIAKRLALAMGGDIRVRSTPGKGAAFTILLPNAAEAESPPTPKPAASPVPSPPKHAWKVLVVDDLEVNREFLREVFVRYGHTVLTASDGEQALAIVNEHAPDLVVMDQNLPGLRGDQCARAMRRNPALARMPVLFLSGGLGSFLEPPEEWPNAELLAKPFQVVDLMAAANRLMQPSP